MSRDALNNRKDENEYFLGTTNLPDISSGLKQTFSDNSCKHIMLLASFLSKMLTLREPYVRVMLSTGFIEIFDELTDKHYRIDNKVRIEDLPLVRLFVNRVEQPRRSELEPYH